MKKQSFFNKLKKEGKLQLTEPSEDIKKAYQKKSESHLISAKILLENNKLEESVSMTYYSMYYTTLALFYQTGIKCENHSAAIILLKKIFKIDNQEISDAKKERIDKQYYIDFHIIKDEVKELIQTAEEFNAKILDFTEKMNNEKIEEFRKRMKKLLK